MALVILVSSGCGALTRQVARNATPAAVESGMKTAMSDENQQAAVQAIDEERVAEATEKLASGTTDGLVKALNDEERQERFAQAMAPMVTTLVDSAMETALSEQQLARIRELAKQATLGFQDAIDEVKTLKEQGAIPQDKANVLEAANDVAETDVTLYLIGGLAAALFLLLVVGTILALRKKRKYDLEGKQRDQALDEIAKILSSESYESKNLDRLEQEHNGSGASSERERLREAMRHLAQRKRVSAPAQEQKQ